MSEIISRKEPRVPTYIGEPCHRGHDGTRYASGGGCRECNIERSTARQKRLRSSPEYQEKCRAYRIQWLLKNPNYQKEYEKRTRDRRLARERLRRVRKTPQIFNCLTCGEPNRNHNAKYCSKRCCTIARREMFKLDADRLERRNRQCRENRKKNYNKEKCHQRYLMEKSDPHFLKKRQEYRRKNYQRRQAALRALKQLGIRVDANTYESRSTAAFRALKQLGIEF